MWTAARILTLLTPLTFHILQIPQSEPARTSPKSHASHKYHIYLKSSTLNTSYSSHIFNIAHTSSTAPIVHTPLPFPLFRQIKDFTNREKNYFSHI